MAGEKAGFLFTGEIQNWASILSVIEIEKTATKPTREMVRLYSATIWVTRFTIDREPSLLSIPLFVCALILVDAENAIYPRS